MSLRTNALSFLLCLSMPSIAYAACESACTFVLKSLATNQLTVIDEARASMPITPYSTFKIANTLIALETGVVKDPAELLTFSRDSYPVQPWWPSIWYSSPLSLKDAFQVSAVPIYQTLATQIGHERMQAHLNAFNYGNKDISSGTDTFWLNGSLKISALQQVNFLTQLIEGALPVSRPTREAFMQIMRAEQGENYTLYAKTGGGPLTDTTAIGWYVGIVQNASGIYVFALNMEGATFDEIKQKRIDDARFLLTEAGVID